MLPNEPGDINLGSFNLRPAQFPSGFGPLTKESKSTIMNSSEVSQPEGNAKPHQSIPQRTPDPPRCLFCRTTSGKRSREHVLRKSFKDKFPRVPSLSFSYMSSSGTELIERPITQFDMTVNNVCRECNQGWLNDLECAAEPIIYKLLESTHGRCLTADQIQLLGFWALVRSLLLTHVSPQGRVPHSVFERAYSSRSVPPGCYVQLGVSTTYLWEAGSHQSIRIQPGNQYLAFVGFGLGGLLFLTSISDSSVDATRLGRDVSRQPRLWFPGSFRWLAPAETTDSPLKLLSGPQAQVCGLSLAVRMGIERPLDQLGNEIDPLRILPSRFHGSLAWKGIHLGQ